MDRKSLRSGYNFVERNLLGKKIEDIEETVSIIAFLRLLRSGGALPRRVKVTGLERLLQRMQDRETSRFLRRILSDASDILMQRGPVILFPVTKIAWNLQPHLVVDGKPVRFYHLLSKGLRQEDVGHFWSGFSLS